MALDGQPTLAQLRIGYFRDFLGNAEVLLVDADQTGLRDLADFAGRLACGERGPNLPGVSFHHCPPVAFELVNHDEGLTRTDSQWACRWTQPKWADIASLIHGMASSAAPCHQFIEPDNPGPMVIISTGEYSDAWWNAAV